MGCDICGKNAVLFRTLVEGSKLNVCENCVKFGKVLERVNTNPNVKLKRKVVEKKQEISEALVRDYNIKIKNARESKIIEPRPASKPFNPASILVALEAPVTPTGTKKSE